eukprot:c54496_g1_i1 orf=214-807(-)
MADAVVSESTTPVLPSPASPPKGDENAGFLLNAGAIKLKDLKESRAELLARVQSLKKDLREWRGKLDTQVKTYRQELGDLRNNLNMEVEQLKSEFQDLRLSLRKQLDNSNIDHLTPNRRLSNIAAIDTEKLFSVDESEERHEISSCGPLSDVNREQSSLIETGEIAEASSPRQITKTPEHVNSQEDAEDDQTKVPAF